MESTDVDAESRIGQEGAAPKVSVVVATFNRASRLRGLIEALGRQTLSPSDFEVIIADDASTDGTPDVLRDLQRTARVDLRVVRNEHNRGPGAARNLGWRSGRAPIVAFTDDDCLPTPGWLEAGLGALRDQTVGVVQGRTIPDPSTPPERWAKTVQIEEFSKRFETCNIFYRADVLREIGGFDEDMPFFGEDTVLGWTALRLGVRSVFAPDALVHHAVTYPGARYYRLWASQHGNWAILMKRFPEMRGEVLWMRLFLKRRHAALIGAVAGIAAGTVYPPAFALALPYVWVQRPRSLHKQELVDHLLGTAFDAAVVAGLVKGSVKERTLVL
jgi:glycosyltransferase involved in cell wall biosynthesis